MLQWLAGMLRGDGFKRARRQQSIMLLIARQTISSCISCLLGHSHIPVLIIFGNVFSQILHRQEGMLGEMFAVVQGDHSRARFVCLKAGHSILGGRYSMPKYYANQSIYDVFYIHEGAW